jgi:SAM-dependent methyltransferase
MASDAERERLLARYYDLEHEGYVEDIDFYVQYALAMDPEKRLPVLELGCGTGRVALTLAKAGFKVVGMDRSIGMLDLLRAKAQGLALEGQVEAIESDMRDLGGVERRDFNLAFCALNTFAYLITTEDQLAMLAAVRERLMLHGILILDVTPPVPDLLPPEAGEVVHQGSYRDTDGTIVHKSVSGTGNQWEQTHDVTIFYDREGIDGSLSRLSHQIKLRWVGRYEIALLLQAAGYKVEQIYGSYELDQYREGSERMIVVART